MGENDKMIGKLEGLLEALSKDMTEVKDLVRKLDREGCSRAGEHQAGIVRAHDRIDRIEGMWKKLVVIMVGVMAAGEGGRQILAAVFKQAVGQ